ncbi:periplasmic heavy metal sensor [Pontivivens ytuae]|uniref:Periplasmic heavy metal sensor n=1 Tax=Pontivivens ytuae TaxID=2789856 RepID=A0A7S9LQC6_9RHOB|nr:periplasmic heavy metal sensor [Pontivivens ytuae]QPH53372.1 periplasmic heavy metal sensor [Pontivivens ytuae]
MTATPGSSRLMRRVLIVSVALNVLVVGLVIGVMIRTGGHGPRLMTPPDLRAVILALPDEARASVRSEVRGVVSGGPAERRARLMQGRAFAAAFTADPMDRAALETILAQRRAAGAEIRVELERALLDEMEKLSVAEREAILEQLRETTMRRRDGGGRP